jgi:hypothetical protein
VSRRLHFRVYFKQEFYAPGNKVAMCKTVCFV